MRFDGLFQLLPKIKLSSGNFAQSDHVLVCLSTQSVWDNSHTNRNHLITTSAAGAKRISKTNTSATLSPFLRLFTHEYVGMIFCLGWERKFLRFDGKDKVLPQLTKFLRVVRKNWAFLSNLVGLIAKKFSSWSLREGDLRTKFYHDCLVISTEEIKKTPKGS